MGDRELGSIKKRESAQKAYKHTRREQRPWTPWQHLLMLLQGGQFSDEEPRPAVATCMNLLGANSRLHGHSSESEALGQHFHVLLQSFRGFLVQSHLTTTIMDMDQRSATSGPNLACWLSFLFCFWVFFSVLFLFYSS